MKFQIVIFCTIFCISFLRVCTDAFHNSKRNPESRIKSFIFQEKKMVRFGNDKLILAKNKFVDNLLRFRNSEEKLMGSGSKFLLIKCQKKF